MDQQLKDEAAALSNLLGMARLVPASNEEGRGNLVYLVAVGRDHTAKIIMAKDTREALSEMVEGD